MDDPKSWSLTYQRFVSGSDIYNLAKKSRSAKRHEVPDKEAQKLYRRGMCDLQIAAALGVSKGDVYKWRKQNGLISNTIRLQERLSRSPKTKKPTTSSTDE